MLRMRTYNAFKCFRNCRQFRNSSIVVDIQLRTLFWSAKMNESFQIVGKTDDKIDK